MKKIIEVVTFVEFNRTDIRFKKFLELFEKERRKTRILETMNEVAAKELVNLMAPITENDDLTTEKITADITLRREYLSGLRSIDIKVSNLWIYGRYI